MVAREVLPQDAYYSFRKRLKTVFQEGFMEPFGDCLERASQAKLRGESVSDLLIACRARAYLEQAGYCIDTLMDFFYVLASGTVEDRDAEWLREVRGRHAKQVEDACVLSNGKMEK